ncbi:Pycsar system effector family protein [Arthrobacter globiformis]|uniref:Pycsar system effector family protein n=1 Tax=Arthrobacter globiformis TaxID=1665 RepID=UPI000B40C9B5|nr:Pycsar system effector family protein [Arthrobacter globiformis]
MTFRHDEPAQLKLATQILSEAREELARADGKAGLLLAAAGVVVGALLAGLLAKDWDPTSLQDCIEWLWWTGTAAGLAGLVSLGCAVWPRTKYRKQRHPKTLSFFGDVIGMSMSELEENLEVTAAKPGRATLDQLKQVSRIVDQKYRWIQRGMFSLALASAACLVSVLGNTWLSCGS